MGTDDGNSHAAGEPHDGACANGADCGYAQIIDNDVLARLRTETAALRLEVARLTGELRKIGAPDEDDCCPVCGDVAELCDLDSKRYPGRAACFGADARLATPTSEEPTP
jgi:hypothetical protein